MGQKVNPHGLRVGIIKDWDSRWYAEGNFADNLVEDDKIRKYVKKKLYNAGISRIEIERASDRVKLIVYTAKPGVVIGKGGSAIEELKKELQKMTDKKLLIDVKEVKRPDKDAQLVAENIAQQLENLLSLLINHISGCLCNTDFFTVFYFVADLCSFSVMNEHHVGNMDRAFFCHNTALLVLYAWFGMFSKHISTFNDDSILLVVDCNNFAFFTLIFSSDDFYKIAFFNSNS